MEELRTNKAQLFRIMIKIDIHIAPPLFISRAAKKGLKRSCPQWIQQQPPGLPRTRRSMRWRSLPTALVAMHVYLPVSATCAQGMCRDPSSSTEYLQQSKECCPPSIQGTPAVQRKRGLRGTTNGLNEACVNWGTELYHLFHSFPAHSFPKEMMKSG